ncbi:MAG TPA: FG-GAP-like repeat-containing protein [Candidatus Acidoferrales bacterium]|nr:FG-GAP-like repeat-containing protein [Candidatus Acidoferrales bacterium]
MRTFRWQSCVLLLVLSFVCAPTPAAPAGGSFKNPPIIPTATDVAGIATADVNHDGKPDLVYVDGTTSYSLHVLLGNGDGTFTHGQDISLPAGICCAVTLADVTGDGKLDVILQGSVNTQAAVAVLVGNGDGTFQSPISTTFQPTCCSDDPTFRSPAGVGDINGDGKADLVLCDILNGALYVLLGNNTGNFTFSSTIRTFTEGVVYLLDLNGDHHLDIVATDNLGARFLVYLGSGDGTFQNYVAYEGQPGTGTLILADLDGDGHPDMIAQWYPSSFGMFKGNPDGTFGALTTISSVTTTNPLILVGDFNGDGVADLSFTNPTGVGIQLGQGSLTYGAAQKSVSGGPSTIYISLAKPVAADFNADSKLDLAMPVEGGIAILIGNGDGTFVSADLFEVGDTVGAAAVADFNSDGSPDIAVSVAATFPRLLLGNGTGSFILKADQNSTYGSQTPNASLIAADFNGDKKMDLSAGPASILPPNSSILVAFGEGNGNFSAPVPVPNGAPVVADFNHDGRADMAYIDGDAVIVSLGQTGDSFASISTPLRLPLESGLYNAGDVNNDGIPDLVLNYYDHLEIWLGKGDGTFTYGNSIEESQIASDVVAAVADVDGDGNADIILAPDPNAGANFGPLAIFFGNGDGTFQAPIFVPVSHRYSQVVVADLNGDKKPDLAMTDGGSVAVLMNQGNRTFAGEVDYVAGGQVSAISVADVNGDGLPDIVAANPGGTTVTVLFNQKSGISGGGGAISGTLSVSPEPSAFNQTITLSLALSGTGSGSPVPTGSVSFSVDGIFVATVSLTNGSASYAYANQLVPTSHTVVAEYNGDKTYANSSFSVQHVVEAPNYPTVTTLTATPSTLLASQTVRLIAQVASNPAVPAGVVTFNDGSNVMGAATVNTSGVAYYDVSVLAAGSHSLTARYDGYSQPGFTITDQVYTAAIFSPSTSAPVSVKVNANPTTTAISYSPTSPTVGTVITLTAQVSSTSGVPFGGASFFDGATYLGTSGLQANGNATYSIASLGAGSHSFTAAFNANGPFAASMSAPQAVTVSSAASNLLPVFVALTVSENTSPSGTLLSAFIAAPGVITGARVTFIDSGAILGTAPVGPNGIASLRVAPLSSGNHDLTAGFTAANTLAPAVSPILNDVWPAAGPGFNLALDSNALNIGQSGKGTLGISILSLGGFAGTAQLSCAAGLPPGYTCEFSPSVVEGNGASTLTIRDSAGIAEQSGSTLVIFSFTFLALSFLFLGVSNRRAYVMDACILICAIGLLSSCVASPSTTARSRTSIVTVRATFGSGGGAIVHDEQVCVTLRSAR